jgi:Kef-type K+ transport system membrane component KefB
MFTRTPSTAAGLLTFISLIAVALVFLFGQIVLLNGVNEGQGFNAISIAVICQSVSLFPAIIIARSLTKYLTTTLNWNTFLAVIVAVIAALGVGTSLSFLSIIVGTFAAGVR